MERDYKMKSILIIIFVAQLVTMNLLSQWVQTQTTPAGGGITDMIVTDAGALIVTTSSFNWPNGQYGGIRRSTDGGVYWEETINGYIARTLAIARGGYIFASSWPYPNPEALYRSTDNGNTFFQQYQIGVSNNIFSIIAPSQDNNTIYLGTRNGVLKSTNGGTIFNPVNSGIPANSWVWDLAADSNNVIAAATSNGMYISTNLGDSWYQSTGVPTVDTVRYVEFYRTQTDNITNDKLIAGTDKGTVLRGLYDDGYTALIVAALLGANVKVETGVGHFASTGELYLSASPRNPQIPGGGIYKSTNEGQTFTVMNNGLPQNPIASKIVRDLTDTNVVTLYTGLFNNQTNGAQVYRQSFPIGLQQISTEVPKEFLLSQNYPNPFNPVTYIEFTVSKSSFVKLVVYDLLGRVVETLVNKQIAQGVYKVDWNASKYPSGVYFYRIETGDFTDTKKMMLVK